MSCGCGWSCNWQAAAGFIYPCCSSATQITVCFWSLSPFSSNCHIRDVQTCYKDLEASATTSSGAPLVDVDSYGEKRTVITLSITIDS